MNFDAAADDLQRRELAHLLDIVTPRPETFRSMTRDAFTAEAAQLAERLGYSVITTAPDLVITMDGRKYIVHCATPINTEPTQTRDIARLHTAIVKAKAYGGFYVTPHSFTPDARHYAATAPIELVDGVKFMGLMKSSKAGAVLPETYKAMCRDCGDIVQHRLDRKETLPCVNGHPVAPTIALAMLFPRPAEPISASNQTKPRAQPKTRRQIKAHNYRLRARGMTKR